MLGYRVPQATTLTPKQIEDIANRILLRHGEGVLQGNAAFDVINYLEFHLVDEHETDYHISDALPLGTYAETRLKLVTISEQIYHGASEGNAFSRFTVTHELGHVALHEYLLMKQFQSSQHATECVMYRRDELEPYCDPEWQADEFAGALLMPRSGMSSLRQRYRDRNMFINKAMNAFQVSYGTANCRTEKMIWRGKLKL
jgi:hypothetical protein